MDNYEGYDPVYGSYDEFKEARRKTDEQNLNSLDRALTYFKDDNANIGRGTKPDINTYIRKTNALVNLGLYYQHNRISTKSYESAVI
jgi:hypothetical protein